jgi:nucleotide-binding universal stress UspA family protein
MQVRTILSPLDFSQPSNKALQNAIELASYFQTELILLHVVSFAPPGIPADPAYAFSGLEEYQKAAKESAEKQLLEAAQQIPPGLKTRMAVENGDAAEEIVRFAANEKADLIVISTHGLTGWRHLVFGSVAEKVIRLADRPVLVIPAHEVGQAY